MTTYINEDDQESCDHFETDSYGYCNDCGKDIENKIYWESRGKK